MSDLSGYCAIKLYRKMYKFYPRFNYGSSHTVMYDTEDKMYDTDDIKITM